MRGKKLLKALIVDDERVVRDFLVRFLTLEEIEPFEAEDASEAVGAMKSEKFDIVFLDVRMPGMDGLELLKILKKIDSGAKYIMMTGYAVDDMLKEAEAQGAITSLKKPFELKEVEYIIKQFKKSWSDEETV